MPLFALAALASGMKFCKHRSQMQNTNNTTDAWHYTRGLAFVSQEALDKARAVELQDNLVYIEPPAFYYPVRESLERAGLCPPNFP